MRRILLVVDGRGSGSSIVVIVIAVFLMAVGFGYYLSCFGSGAATAADDADDCQEDASENAEHDCSNHRSDIALVLCAAVLINSASILTLTHRNPLTIVVPGHAAISHLVSVIVVIAAVIVVLAGVTVSGHTLGQEEERHRADNIKGSHFTQLYYAN